MGLGCNNFGMRIDEAASRAVVHAALDVGINFFDTADSYGEGKSEEYLGRALGARRKDIILGTKFGYSGGASRDTVVRSVEGSLKRLGADAVDLYTVHKPDPDTPIDETLEAMDRLVRAGKVRYMGCSNFSAATARRGLGRGQGPGPLAVCRGPEPAQPVAARGGGRYRLGVPRPRGRLCPVLSPSKAAC